MGLEVDTSETWEYTLVLDRAKPKDQQRKLVCRFMSVRDSRKVEKLFDSALPSEVKTFDDIIEKVTQGLSVFVVGWKGFRKDGKEVPFDLKELDYFLGESDYIELRDNMLYNQTLELNEKKLAVLRSLSTTDNYAKQTGAATV